MGILVTAEGEDWNTKVVTPENGEVFTLKELQTLVGGFIEVVPQRVHPDKVYLCDEEGLLKGKEINVSIVVSGLTRNHRMDIAMTHRTDANVSAAFTVSLPCGNGRPRVRIISMSVR